MLRGKHNTILKKSISMLLTLVMVVGMLPIHAHAAVTDIAVEGWEESFSQYFADVAYTCVDKNDYSLGSRFGSVTCTESSFLLTAKQQATCPTTTLIITVGDEPVIVTYTKDDSVSATVESGSPVPAGAPIKFSVTSDANGDATGTVTIAVEPVTEEIPEDAATFDVNGAPYSYLDKAIDAAKSGDTIVVTQSGIAYHSKGETTFTIPVGVNLLVPHGVSTGGTYYGDFDEAPKKAGSDEELGTSQKPYVTLTLASGTTIDCQGQICVNSRMWPEAGSGTGLPTGTYGHIDMESGSQIILTDADGSADESGKLYCYGYITGDGEVIATSGTKVHEVFQMLGWMGGHSAKGWGAQAGIFGDAETSIESFLFNDYAIQNIEAELTIHYGATARAVATVTAAGATKHVGVDYVGKNTGLVQLVNEGAALHRSYDPATNNMTYTLEGTAKIGNVRIKIEFEGLEGAAALLEFGTATFDLNSANHIFAIPTYMDFVAGEGSEVTLLNDYKLMPGASITIEDNAHVYVNGDLYLYDTVDYVDHGYRSGNSIPVKYIATLEKRSNIPQMNENTSSAQIVLEGGTLEVLATGGLYTTDNGGKSADKVLKGEGTFINGSANNSSVLDELKFSGTHNANVTPYAIQTTPIVGRLAGITQSAGAYDPFETGTYHGLGEEQDNYWYQGAEKLVASTCADAEHYEYTCAGATGEPYKVFTGTPALPHTNSAYVSTTAPTCTEDGYETWSCDVCGTYKTNFKAALGHNYEGQTCSRCSAENPYKTYRWEIVEGELTSLNNDKVTENALTKLKGGVTDGVLQGAQYQLAQGFNLKSSQPWVIEWKSSDTTANWCGFLFSETESRGGYYLHQSNSGEKGTQLNFGGYSLGNIGLKLKDLGINIAQGHIYHLENRIEEDGNHVYLIVDGKEIGMMGSGIYGMLEKDDWLNNSSASITMKYIGATANDGTYALVSGLALDYLEVQESGCVHDYAIAEYAANCVSNGYTTYTCRLCGHRYTGSQEAGLGKSAHTFVNDTCTVCGENRPAARYHWEIVNDELVSITNGGATENDATLLHGSITNRVIKNAVLELEEAIHLNHDQEWVIEWKTYANTAWSGFLFSATENYGGKYLFQSSNTSNYNLIFGIPANIGLSMKTLNVNTAGEHIYRLENQIDADGAKVHLIVDGVDRGVMGSGDAAVSANPDWLNNGTTDMEMRYIGTYHPNNADPNVFAVNNLKLAYLKVWEQKCDHVYSGKICSLCGEENPNKSYRWEMQNNQLVSANNEQFTGNAATKNYGSVSGNVMQKAQFDLANAVTLKSNQPWVIEWKAMSNSSNVYWNGMLLSETASGGKYVFQSHSDDNGAGYQLNIGGSNVGFKLKDLGVQHFKEHIYRLENRVTATTNQVYLIVDGVEMGVMGSGNAGVVASSDWLNNQNYTLSFKSIGRNNDTFALNNLKLSYLEIQEAACDHDYTVTVHNPTCIADGFTSHECKLCGNYYISNVVAGGGQTAHTYVNGTCTDCGAVKSLNYYHWAIENNELVSKTSNGATKNEWIHLQGSIQNGILKNARYVLEDAIELNHDEEWIVQWETAGNGSTSWNGMFLSSSGKEAVSGMRYLMQSASGNKNFSFGVAAPGYQNYGYEMATENINTAQNHVYRLENRIENGVNTVYLMVDGNEIGAMDTVVGSTTKNNWANQTDVIFRYMGVIGSSDAFTVNNMKLNYLKVWEGGCEHQYSDSVCIHCGKAMPYQSYRWEMQNNTLTNVTTGFASNPVTLKTGTVSNNVMQAVQYELANAVLLNHDQPWVIEWKVLENSTRWAGMLFSETEKSGGKYIFQSADASANKLCELSFGSPNLGYKMLEKGIDTSKEHIYRFENRVNPANNTNQVYLIIDGKEIGAVGTATDWLNNGTTDMAMKYIGQKNDGHTYFVMSDLKLDYLEVHESDCAHNYTSTVTDPSCTEQGYTTHTCGLCGYSYQSDYVDAIGSHNYDGKKICSRCGEENPYKVYRWEMQNNTLNSISNDVFTSNAATKNYGNVSDNVMQKAQFNLANAVTLKSNQPWVIQWKVLPNSNNAVWNGMLFSGTADSGKYVFQSHTSGNGYQLNIGSANVGLKMKTLGINTAEEHIYRLENRVTATTNEVYLIVDGVEMGKMGSGNAGVVESSDWLNNQNYTLSFKSIGRNNDTFALNNLKLEYLAVWEGGCTHSYVDRVVAPTCSSEGYTSHTCSDCGKYYESDYVAAGGHSFNGKYCSICGANNPVNPENPLSANWPVLNTDLTHIICYGQSLSVGGDAPYHADEVVDGVYMYGSLTDSSNGTVLKPLNASSQHPIISAVNSLMKMLQADTRNNIDTDIVAGSYGLGAASIAQLMSAERQAEIKAEEGYTYNCADGGSHYAKFQNSVSALAAYAENTQQTISSPAIIYLQGEADEVLDEYRNVYKYCAGNDKEKYKEYLKRLKEDMQAEVMEAYGQEEAPLFMLYQVSGMYIKHVDMEIAMAQLEFAEENDDVILLQTPYFTPQYRDGYHLSTNGYRWFGEYVGKYLYTTLVQREEIAPLLPERITLGDDNAITIQVSGVEGGLSIDTTLVEDASNANNRYGFTVYADGVKYVPTSVTVSGSTIRLVCDVEDGVFQNAASLKVAYAAVDAIGTGNIRDNCTDKGFYQYLDDTNDLSSGNDSDIVYRAPIVGENYPLYNWLAGFSYDISENERRAPAYYNWEIVNGVLTSIADQNTPIVLQGGVENGALMAAQYQLEKSIMLYHDREWVVEWKASGNNGARWNGMLLATDKSPNSGIYYLAQSNNTEHLRLTMGERETTGSYHDYGYHLTSKGIDTLAEHVYRLENRIDENGKNMVYLVIDDKEVGAMNIHLSTNRSNQWLNGRDLMIPYIGVEGSLVNNMKLSYLKVWEEGCEHSYGAVVTAPTCTADGYTTYTCSVCGDTYTEDIDALTHNLVDVAGKEATCTEDGYTAHKDCSRCDYVEGKEVLTASGHNYTAVYVWAEDFSEVTATATCQKDNSHVVTETVTSTSEVTTKPTAENDGVRTYTATFTKEQFTTQTKTVEIPKLEYAGSGYCGDEDDGANLTWTLAFNGTLTISGSGAMKNYEDNDRNPTPWSGYGDQITKVVIKEGVTTIGEWAFAYMANLASVELPNTLTSIGESAFQNCTALMQIVIPGSVTTINWKAFQNCTALESAELSAALTSIALQVFAGCTALEEIIIPAAVTNIGQEAFMGCTSLARVNMSEMGVTIFGNYAFSGCTALTEIDIPDSVTVLGVGTFSGCTALTTVDLPNTLGSVDSYAFAGCTALEEIVLPDTIQGISDGAFNGCTALTAIDLPEALMWIGAYAFAECDALTAIIIPNNGHRQTIGERAFEGCDNLTTVDLSEGVVTLGNYALADCAALESITFRRVPEIIGDNALANVTATVYYPVGWTGDSVGTATAFGATKLTWIPATDGGEEEEDFVPVIGNGNGTTNGTVNDDGSVTFKAGTNGPEVTVSKPTDGWIIGENTFTVASTNDVACVVLVKKADGSYTRVTATTENGIHSFTANLSESDEIVVAVKGDVNGNGVVDATDYTITKRIVAGTYSKKTAIMDYVGDFNDGNSIDASDYTKMKRIVAGTFKAAWDK